MSAKQKRPSLTVILPVYNEVTLVASATKRCCEALAKDFDDYEVLLINDGSTDKTGEAMDAERARNPRVQVLHNQVNLNVGASIQRGFTEATKEYVVHNAIDLPLAPEGLGDLIDRVGNADVLILERSGYPGYSIWRLLCSTLNRRLLRMLFPSPFHDLNFTQVYRREVIAEILPRAKSPAFTTPEMIFRALRRGLKVRAIRWNYERRPSGKGAFGKPSDIVWSLSDMMKYRFYFSLLALPPVQSGREPSDPRLQGEPKRSAR